METVDYRAIDGYPYYRVGSDGSVWSRKRGRGIVDEWRQLRQNALASGHKAISLVNEHGGKKLLVHRLVLRAFVGEPPPKHEALHGDGNPANNRLSNLRWGTRAENMQDAIRHGRVKHGSAHYRSKLTEEAVRGIKRDIAAGVGRHKIAYRYGVAVATIQDIAWGITWKHVSIEPDGQQNCMPFTWVAA
jgi:hypothetical protein